MSTVSGGMYGGSTLNAGSTTPPAMVLQAYGYGNVISGDSYNVSIYGGFGSASVSLGSGSDLVQLDGYNNSVTGTSGQSTISGALGESTITLGGGNNFISLGGYFNQIALGTGSNTVIAGAGSDSVTLGSGANQVTLAGYDNAVSINGANTGTDTITAGSGGDTITLVNAIVTIAAGSGATVALSGNQGDVTDKGTGTSFTDSSVAKAILNVVSDPNWTLDLTGAAATGLTTPGDVLSHLTLASNGTDTKLTLDGGAVVITFQGEQPAAITASHFKIG